MGGTNGNLPGNANPFDVILSTPKASVVAVAGTPELIVPPNAGRNNLLIMNLSNDTMYIWTDGTVSPANGFILVPNGGFFKLARWEDYDFTTYGFYGIAAAAGGNIFAFEQSKIA